MGANPTRSGHCDEEHALLSQITCLMKRCIQLPMKAVCIVLLYSAAFKGPLSSKEGLFI